MHRGALRLGAWLAMLTPCASALAHREPPAALEVLSHDAEGVRALSLTHGLAVRRAANRFQYVCPAAWGAEYPEPFAALADGTILVGAPSGLQLLGEDGTLRAHPDPIAVGRTDDLVRTERGLFSVRSTQTGSELLAVDAQTARVLWQGSGSLYSLAALDQKLVLVRNTEFMLEQVTVAMADGQELERQVVVVDIPIDDVIARASAGTAYALVMFRSETVLGSLQMNAFTEIAVGALSIAGPLRVGDSTLVAVDGELSRLVGNELEPIVVPNDVLCLDQDGDLSYACDSLGVARVDGPALGETVFELSWMVGPDLTLLEGAARDLCSSQWQDLRLDLTVAGIPLLADEMPDPGIPAAGVGSVPVSGMGTAGAAAAGGGRAPQAGAASTAMGPSGASGGCRALPSQGASSTLYLWIALAVVARRRARALRASRQPAP